MVAIYSVQIAAAAEVGMVQRPRRIGALQDGVEQQHHYDFDIQAAVVPGHIVALSKYDPKDKLPWCYYC